MNSEIVKHIEKLLYESECVIIPGFGAFIARHVPASINDTAGRIDPASKYLAFNPSLKNNDGILINEIASAEGLSYAQASTLVSAWVKEALDILDSSRSLEIAQAGSFVKGPEDQIIFQPKQGSNYEVRSYGLPSLPLYRSEIEEVEDQDVEVLLPASIPAEVLVTVKKPSRRRVLLAAGVLGCLLAAGVIIGKNTFFDKTQFSSLNPLNFDSNVIDKMVEEADKKESESLPLTPATEEKEDTAPVIAETDSVFFAVGGAFAIQNNAFKFSRMLSAKGYQPEIIKQDGYRLIRVTYNTSYDRASAEAFLNEIRSKENPEIWLLALSRKDFNTIQK